MLCSNLPVHVELYNILLTEIGTSNIYCSSIPVEAQTIGQRLSPFSSLIALFLNVDLDMLIAAEQLPANHGIILLSESCP